LARYGGLRIPSELRQWTWDDIDWHGGNFAVRAPKREPIDGHETRIVPIFPEIRPYLQQAFSEASACGVHVLPGEFHREGCAYASAAARGWPIRG
jgi:integrase